MIENNHYENPKQAVIRLLKSQGCCQTEQPRPDPHLQEMTHYRDQLSLQTAQERTKLADIPCAITLAEEISELKEVINGLGRENRGRMDHLGRVQQKVTVNASWETSDGEEQREHERLQQEYGNLLRSLQTTNESNRRLVERLARW